MRRSLVAACGLAGVCLSAGRALLAQATPSARVPADPDVRTGTLPNGLRYYVRHNALPRGRAFFVFVVNAGSVLEDDDQRGLAHFVEHLAFNGSQHFPHQGIIDWLTSVGMVFGNDVNASTTFDETTYYFYTPAEPGMLDTALLVMDDWAHNLTLSAAAVEKERGIIFEERRLQQGPGERASEVHAPVLFGDRYASRNPIGLGETILHAPRAAIQRFYHDWYRPDLETVIAVGDFDANAMEAKLRATFGRIPARASERPRPAVHVVAHRAPVASVVADPQITEWSADLVFPRPDRDPVVTDATIHRQVVDRVFYSVLNERLHALARAPHAPVSRASAGGMMLGRTVPAYTIHVVAAEPTTLELGITAVQAEVARIARDGATAAELARARKRLVDAATSETLAARGQTSDALAMRYVQNALSGRPTTDPRAEARLRLQFIPTITSAAVQSVAAAILATPGPVVLATVPKSDQYAPPEKDELLAALQYGAARTLPVYADTAHAETLLAQVPTGGHIIQERRYPALGVTEWRLSNGARVLLKPTPFARDTVVVQGIRPGGLSAASDQQYPDAAVASTVVRRSGLGAYDSTALARRLVGRVDDWAVTIAPYQDEVMVQGSPRHAQTVFQLLYLACTAPRLDRTAFTHWRRDARRQPLDPFKLEVLRATTQRNPRVRPIAGPIADSVAADTALAFYRARFADAGQFTFLIVGDFSVDSVRQTVAQYVGGLPGRPGAAVGARDVGIRPPVGVVRHAVVGDDSASTTRIVFDAPVPYSLQQVVVAQALQAVLRRRVRLRLREEMSGVYSPSVSCTVTDVPYAHATAVLTFTSAPERAGPLRQALMAVLDTLVTGGVTPSELHDVQVLVRRQREAEAQSNGYWLTLLRESAVQHLSLEDLAAWEQQMATVTPAMIATLAKTLLDPHQYVVVTKVPVRMAPVNRDELISARQW